MVAAQNGDLLRGPGGRAAHGVRPPAGRARPGPDDRPVARGRLRRRRHRFLAARGPGLGLIIASRGSRVDAGHAPSAAARHGRRARPPLARRSADRAARPDDRDPALGHGRVPAARRGRRRAGGDVRRRGSRRRSSRASGSRSVAGSRAGSRLSGGRCGDRGRRPCGHPQSDPARARDPVAAGRAVAGRGRRDRGAARRHAHAADLHRRGRRAAPARRRPRGDGDRARPRVRARAHDRCGRCRRSSASPTSDSPTCRWTSC